MLLMQNIPCHKISGSYTIRQISFFVYTYYFNLKYREEGTEEGKLIFHRSPMSELLKLLRSFFLQDQLSSVKQLS